MRDQYVYQCSRIKHALKRQIHSDAKRRSYITRTRDASTRRWPSAGAVRRPVYGRRSAASETASTMPWRRVFSPCWNVSCWTGAHSAHLPRRSVPSSSSSRVGTIRIVGIQRWAICSQSTSSGSIPSTRAGFRPQMWDCPLKRGNSNNTLKPFVTSYSQIWCIA